MTFHRTDQNISRLQKCISEFFLQFTGIANLQPMNERHNSKVHIILETYTPGHGCTNNVNDTSSWRHTRQDTGVQTMSLTHGKQTRFPKYTYLYTDHILTENVTVSLTELGSSTYLYIINLYLNKLILCMTFSRSPYLYLLFIFGIFDKIHVANTVTCIWCI